MRSTSRWLAFAIPFAVSICSAANADVVSYTKIVGARSANDMSPNGRFIVGGSDTGRAYILDTTTNVMTLLPPECDEAIAVSDNGTAVVGDIYIPNTTEEVAAIWTAASGVWTSLGYLPNAGTCPSRSDAYEISADGSIVVGLSWDGCSGRGFKWTAATGMVELQSMANGANRASVLSANGSLIGGFAQGSFDRTPAYWTRGSAGHLIDPPSGNLQGEVYGINDAGTLMLGSRNGRAALWDYPSLTPTILGSLLPGWGGIAMDVANDGTVVGFDFLSGNRRAWLHRPGPGSCIDIKTYVEGNGGVVPAGTVLEVCQAISTDGLRIIGHSFGIGAWMVRIAPACPADVAPSVHDNIVNTDDLLVVIQSWGPCQSANCPGDIAPIANRNGVVDTDDLLAVISAWGACPPPVGGCCTGSSCAQMTQSACVAAGGTYLGNSVPCGVSSCANNDSCASAINITNKINNGTTNGDNSTATPPIFGGHDPEQPIGMPTCQWDHNADEPHSSVWYTFVAPANGSVTIAMCSSVVVPFYDSLLALYEGGCGSPNMTQVACDEDGCSDDPALGLFSRIVTTSLTPGQTYRICVMNTGGYAGSQPGPFKLTIASP